MASAGTAPRAGTRSARDGVAALLAGYNVVPVDGIDIPAWTPGTRKV